MGYCIYMDNNTTKTWGEVNPGDLVKYAGRMELVVDAYALDGETLCFEVAGRTIRRDPRRLVTVAA